MKKYKIKETIKVKKVGSPTLVKNRNIFKEVINYKKKSGCPP